MPDRPLFLERASFHRRRLGDAARILPVLSMLLLLVPVWWMPASLSYAAGAVWLFGLWAVLIIVIWVLHRALLRAEAATIRASEVAPAVPPSSVPHPAVPQPTVPRSATPHPAVPQPTVPRSATPQPAVPQPAVPRSAVPHPAVPPPAVPPSAVSPPVSDPGRPGPAPAPDPKGGQDAL